jgi:hypothetical protein
MTHRSLSVSRVCAALSTGLASLSFAALAGCAADVRVLHDHSNLSNGKDAGTKHEDDASPGSGGAAPSGSGGATASTGSGGAKPSMGSGGAPAAAGSGSGGPPTDLYVMLDQSSSLSDPVPGSSSTWWTVATNAIRMFLNDPAAAGTGVGLQYFPLGGIAPASCMADYATPEVEIAALPGNIGALTASLAMHEPIAFTPTAPALQGAIAHMKAWAPAHPGRVPAVVFVTDGFPTECDPQDIDDVAGIAASGVASAPVVRTFVIGLNLGLGGANYDVLANAGGTGHVMSINSDVTANLIAALRGIIGERDGG